MNKAIELVVRYQAAGIGNGTMCWPDKGTLGVYQAFAFKNNNILLFENSDSEGVLLSSLPHEEQKRVMDAIDTLLVKHLACKAAEQAIHDRIMNPWQRSFTPNQLDALNLYHQISAPDAPASEVFSRLLNEVAEDPDVRRCPEKWVADTAKELDEIAKGNVREESQQLKR